MTFDQITNRFKGVADDLGLPFGYAPFRDGQQPKAPYIAINYPERKPFPADNLGYVHISRIRILLVTPTKNITLEQAVEDAFEELGVQYSKEEDFYQDEGVFIIVHETEELINAD